MKKGMEGKRRRGGERRGEEEEEEGGRTRLKLDRKRRKHCIV